LAAIVECSKFIALVDKSCDVLQNLLLVSSR